MSDIETAPFVAFGTSHLVAIGAILAVSVGLPLGLRRFAAERLVRRLGAGVGVFGAVHELVKTWAWVAIWEQPLAQGLPLHICGTGLYLTVALLIWRHQRVYEVVYFWGLAGGLQAILTPELPYGFAHPFTVSFFISHGLIIFGLCYATFAFRLRPTWGSIPRVFAITLGFAFLIVAPLNLLLDTNYMYLRGKPVTGSVLDLFGPWPWYIAGTAAFTFASFVFYYLPFWLGDVLRRRSGDAIAARS